MQVYNEEHACKIKLLTSGVSAYIIQIPWLNVIQKYLCLKNIEFCCQDHDEIQR